jgi:apolipoprotein N-acyltransferase
VPFGEYIPLRWLFPKFIEKIAYGLGDLTLGKEFPLIKIGESYALPIICYEALFSTYISNFDLNKAEFIVNVTNDNWFGDSIGPHQHLAMARFRAIEYGKPLIRIANTGISAAFDRFGKNLDSIPLNHQGIIDLKIDITQRAKTFYGTNIVWLSNTLLLLICMTNALNLLFHNKQAIYKNGSRIIS